MNVTVPSRVVGRQHNAISGEKRRANVPVHITWPITEPSLANNPFGPVLVEQTNIHTDNGKRKGTKDTPTVRPRLCSGGPDCLVGRLHSGVPGPAGLCALQGLPPPPHFNSAIASSSARSSAHEHCCGCCRLDPALRYRAGVGPLETEDASR